MLIYANFMNIVSIVYSQMKYQQQYYSKMNETQYIMMCNHTTFISLWNIQKYL